MFSAKWTSFFRRKNDRKKNISENSTVLSDSSRLPEKKLPESPLLENFSGIFNLNFHQFSRRFLAGIRLMKMIVQEAQLPVISKKTPITLYKQWTSSLIKVRYDIILLYWKLNGYLEQVTVQIQIESSALQLCQVLCDGQSKSTSLCTS